MALIHPGKSRGMSLSRKQSVQKELHPAIGLLCGFTILVSVAMLVHAVFHFAF